MGRKIILREEDKEFIFNNFSELTLKEISENIGVSVGVVRYFCENNGLKKERQKNWTEEEIGFLNKNFSKMTNKEIAISLNRTYTSVVQKCNEIMLTGTKQTYWKDWEIKYLKENYFHKTNIEIATHLGRNRYSVSIKAGKLGLRKNKGEYNLYKRVVISKDDLKLIEDIYGSLNNMIKKQIEIIKSSFLL